MAQHAACGRRFLPRPRRAAAYPARTRTPRFRSSSSRARFAPAKPASSLTRIPLAEIRREPAAVRSTGSASRLACRGPADSASGTSRLSRHGRNMPPRQPPPPSLSHSTRQPCRAPSPRHELLHPAAPEGDARPGRARSTLGNIRTGGRLRKPADHERIRARVVKGCPRGHDTTANQREQPS